MRLFLTWLADRLRERSTWIGFIGLLSALGLSLEPQQQEAIIHSGVAIISGILAFTKDTPPKA